MKQIEKIDYESAEYSLEELKKLKYALDQSAIVGITDNGGRIIYANEHFLRVTKYTKDELIGQDHRILNSGYHPKSFFKDMWSTIGKGDIWRGEICNRAKDGSLYWVQTTIVPFMNEKGKPYQYISIRVDITEQKNIKRIRHMAYHDELTGLPNRRMLNTVLPEKLQQATEHEEKIALIFMDIDRFKNINDSFGHSLGDLFLVEVAERLRNLKLGDNQIFRLSGDEFIILIYNIDNIDNIQTVVKAMINLFKDSFTIEGYEFFANISVGVSLFPEHGLDGEALVRHANRAMFSAKEIPGSTCVFYQSSMETDYEEIIRLDTKLRQAIENDELKMYYQPKIDPFTRKMTSMESLIRWFDDELGFIPPNKFIPLAEDRGIINKVGEWTIKAVAEQIKAWQPILDDDFRIAVNISPTHFKEASFVKNINKIISNVGIDFKHLEIEITENSMMDYTEELIEKLSQLKELGITIAIDDFGTGFSSLNYLREFPIDALKIDKSFVDDLLTDEKSVAFIAAIIKLAHALDLHVVAEGVEEADQLAILKEHECDLIQGYYYSRPIPPEQITDVLAKFG